MQSFNTDKLSNNIKVITRKNPNTPRIAINMFMGSGVKYEKLAGIANLTGRLLLQGTQTRSAEELANELDNNAIELSVESKQDFLRARSLFLNEDFEKAVDLLEDIIKNSTFEHLEKEKIKFTGELKLELDSPKTQAFDNLIKTMFKDHPYGHSHTTILEEMPRIKIEDIRDYYFKTSLIPDKMVISVVGDIDRGEILEILEEKFGSIKQLNMPDIIVPIPEITENKTVTISRKDAAQAQIVQGWIGPAVSDEDYPAITVLNVILGASGLSSRLFVELRDKKGLAYHVRSSLEALKHLGLFTVYIGTAPNNIETCIEGFGTEINKLKNELVLEKELNDAKNNYFGKRAFMHETNAQQSYYLGYYDIMALGCGFDVEIEEKVKKVTSEDIKRVANKYFSQNSVISMLYQLK
ncbi:MAG TPA: pitrilysin family protein [Candidatus Gastranaerophilales bacterium]|nr:pitrilysin family protein [Candidatus Gastranaerophilales bacterium]